MVSSVKEAPLCFILHRCSKHYQEYFGDKHMVQETALANIPQQAMKLESTEREEKVKKTITKFKGNDRLPGDWFMVGGDADAELLSTLFVLVGRRESFRKASVMQW